MVNNMFGFILWGLVSCCFIGLGIYLLLSKRQKPIGFWANAKEPPQVDDVKGYNRACGWLWFCYGIVLFLLGLPLLGEQNSAGVIISILGTMWASIALVAFYSTVIWKKYGKKKS